MSLNVNTNTNTIHNDSNDNLNTDTDKDTDTKIEIAIKQSNYRIIIKTLIYRVIGILVSFSVCYFFFKNRTLAIKLSIVIEIIQTLVYYIYEYIWNEITWGVKS